MSVCPRCFTELPQIPTAFVCQSGQCKSELDEVAAAWVAPGAEVQLAGLTVGRFLDDAPVLCAGCGIAAIEVCPVCHEPFLPGWRSARVTTIALVGARKTGKTIYIAVVIRELKEHLAKRGIHFLHANEATRRVYENEYDRHLFKERALPQSTPAADTDDSPQRTPLIWRIGTESNEYLVLRDAAGDDFIKLPNSIHLHYLRRADLLLFFLGVERFDVVSRTQGGSSNSPDTSAGDPALVVEALREILDGAKPKMGVVLTKADKLQEYAGDGDNDLHSTMVNPAMSLRREPEYDKAAVAGQYEILDSTTEDWALLHEEIRSFWKRHECNTFVPQLEHYSPQYFAVSALGHGVVSPGEVNPRGISPYRCLDPILWILVFKKVELGNRLIRLPATISQASSQREQPKPDPSPPPRRGFNRFRKKRR